MPAGDTEVGFIGLGAMGSEIASRLLEAGFPLAVFDTSRARMEPFARRAAICDSPAAVADRAETVFVSLPTPEAVREVVCGPDGLLAGGAIRTFGDLSTTGAGTARELAEKLSAAGISYLDAPVSGGVAGARAGSLGLFLAVEENLFERVEPMLNAFAGNVISVGTQPGQGQLAKLLNNVLSATAMAATAEVLVIGVRAGLEAKVLLEAFNAGTGRNSATTSKFPDQILPRTFETGFRLELMIKDLSLALEEGHAQGTPMILAAAVSQVWAAAGASVGGEADFSEIARLFENWAGVELNDAGRPAHDTSKD